MIELLEGTDKYPLSKIGKCAGICWGSPIDNTDKNIKRAKDCIVSGHGRTLEYVDVEMVISNVSARVIREWYTHIGGSPTRLQESTRYVKWSGQFEENFVISSKVKEALDKDAGLKISYENYIKSFQSLLDDLEAVGVPKEDMAMFYPLGMKTKIVDKRNLRNLIEMFHQRTCSRAYWEYRKLMKEIYNALYNYSEEWQWVCENCFKPKCEVYGYCTEAKSCGRKPKR